MTTTLADRDQVIGDLINNLNDVLETIGDRDEELAGLIVELPELRLRSRRGPEAILGSLDSVSALAVQTADLVTGIRPPLVKDVKELRQVADNLDKDKAEIDRALQMLPIKLDQDRPHRDLRLVLQLLPLQLPGHGHAAPVLAPSSDVIPIDYDTGRPARCDLG